MGEQISRRSAYMQHICRRADFKIYDPSSFDPKWFSHKLKGPGLQHDVGISIVKGHIVWAHCPYPSDSFPDLIIFHIEMKAALRHGEKAISDRTYQDENYVMSDDVNDDGSSFHSTSPSTSSPVLSCGRQYYTANDRKRRTFVKNKIPM